MVTYSVVMGQALIVDSIINKKLITGTGSIENSLQSCSAIFFHNAATLKTGIYHFPAGNIQNDLNAQRVIDEMSKDISPTEVYIAYGTLTFDLFDNNPVIPSDPFYPLLRSYILKQIPTAVRVQSLPATTRIASAYFDKGKFKLDNKNIYGLTDLQDFEEGNYDFGRVLWSYGDKSPKLKSKKRHKKAA